MKKLTGTNLKMIAIVFMVIDHVNTYIGPSLHLPLWVSLLGRFVAPLFVFLLVEGFTYTHSKKKYAIRLFLSGILMHLINLSFNLVTHATIRNQFTNQIDSFLLFQGNNIFMTLAFVFSCIWIIETLRFGKKKLSINVLLSLLLIPVIFGLLISEGGPYEIVAALIFYFFRNNFSKIAITFSIYSALLLIHSLRLVSPVSSLYETLTFSNEYMMITVLPFIYLYNSKQGSNRYLNKWFFYVFYPAHLILIRLIGFIIG